MRSSSDQGCIPVMQLGIVASWQPCLDGSVESSGMHRDWRSMATGGRSGRIYVDERLVFVLRMGSFS